MHYRRLYGNIEMQIKTYWICCAKYSARNFLLILAPIKVRTHAGISLIAAYCA